MKARVPVPPARPVVSVSKNNSARGSSVHRDAKAPQNAAAAARRRRMPRRCRPGAISRPGTSRSRDDRRRARWRALRCSDRGNLPLAARMDALPRGSGLRIAAASGGSAGDASRRPVVERRQLVEGELMPRSALTAPLSSPARAAPAPSAASRTSSCTCQHRPDARGATGRAIAALDQFERTLHQFFLPRPQRFAQADAAGEVVVQVHRRHELLHSANAMSRCPRRRAAAAPAAVARREPRAVAVADRLLQVARVGHHRDRGHDVQRVRRAEEAVERVLAIGEARASSTACGNCHHTAVVCSSWSGRLTGP